MSVGRLSGSGDSLRGREEREEREEREGGEREGGREGGYGDQTLQ